MTEKTTYNDLLLEILRQEGDVPEQGFSIVTALGQPLQIPQKKSKPPPTVLPPSGIQKAIDHAETALNPSARRKK